MHKLYDLKERLIEEMEDYADRSNLSKEDVEVIKYMASAADHICGLLEKADMDDEYSMAMRGRGTYSRRGRSYNTDGYSMAQRRDSMGRYSRAKEDFKMELQDLINDAPNDKVREKMQNIMYEM